LHASAHHGAPALFPTGEALDPRPLVLAGATDLLRCLKLALLESRILFAPARQPTAQGQQLPQPSLASAALLAFASLLPHGLLPPPPPGAPAAAAPAAATTTSSSTAASSHGATDGAWPPLPADWQAPPGSLVPFDAQHALLPGASCWHAHVLRPGRSTVGLKSWCAAAVDEASALLLAPLAQVVLTLRAGSSSGGGGAEVNWTTASGLATTQLHVQEKHLLAACALTHGEQAFANKLSAACRTAAADPDASTAKWEGSSDWVRSEVHAHMARLLATATKQILEGDAKPLNDFAGAPWVSQWALTDNFQRWVVANKLHGPARLWCARLAASRTDDLP